MTDIFWSGLFRFITGLTWLGVGRCLLTFALFLLVVWLGADVYEGMGE